MAIQTRNKRMVAFSMASMSDLVFLLLIFFMLTSTLVAPNAIKLLLPSSNSKTMAKQTVTVYINEAYDFFIDDTQVDPKMLSQLLAPMLEGDAEGTVVLRSDHTVPVQYVVDVIDAVNEVNNLQKTNHKVILATKPRR
ncbi:MAG: biopolymer transporter ExbD [Bacteroidetes bacterium]|nr:biopolymer transporter ExbD [Bacteroidota bacterium]